MALHRPPADKQGEIYRALYLDGGGGRYAQAAPRDQQAGGEARPRHRRLARAPYRRGGDEVWTDPGQ